MSKAAMGEGNLEYKKLNYIAKDDLEPIEGNLDLSLKAVVQDLKSDDWARQFEALNQLRRMLQFHTNHLINSSMFSLHSTTGDIVKLVESLRSNLSKNALITLNEMSHALKRSLDSEAESIILKLIKKGNDANSFIAEEVKKTMAAVAANLSDTKVIPILVSINNAKSVAAKSNICLAFESVVVRNENRINQIRDFDKLVVSLANYMLDGALEVRNCAKRGYA
mmetsp:Transcript_22471/g.19422  ORF Transcript_22471/g.19422 Transcript_22471/m.19422 type:complete len:223 (-) Transcript_22471:365-1033(-)